MRFQALIQDTLTALAPLGCQSIALPHGLARIERNEVDGVLVMETQFVAVADWGELRLVHIYAPKINVLTLFFFPNCQWQLPVYCLELVVFGTQPVVALLDALCVMPMTCKQVVSQFMTAAHDAHPHLLQADDTPDWFNHCRSGLDFFLRPQNDEQLFQLGQIHLALLATAFKPLLEQAALFNKDSAAKHRDCLQNYKNHHQLHAPGLRLMNRSFGEAWTADYMNTLFR